MLDWVKWILPDAQRKRLMTAAALGGSAGLALATSQTVMLTPIADTTLIATAPDNNMGGQYFFNAGTTQNGTLNRALLQFDLTGSIPAGSIIESAFLNLWVVGTPPSEAAQNSAFQLHRVLLPWGEGDNIASNPQSPGLGAPASENEATWNSRFHDTGQSWSMPGGVLGVDFATSLSSSEFIEDERNYLFDTNPRMVSDAQQWLDDPASNFGWMLMTSSEETRYTARRFASREDGFNAPLLTVTFQPVPEPGPWLFWCGGALALLLLRRP